VCERREIESEKWKEGKLKGKKITCGWQNKWWSDMRKKRGVWEESKTLERNKRRANFLKEKEVCLIV